MKLVTVDQMRALERQADERGVSYATLMESAGVAVARSVRRWLGGAAGRNVAVLVGPGNNGGDGLVAARQLHDWGAVVSVALPMARSGPDENFDAVARRGIAVLEAETPGFVLRLQECLRGCDAVVDALLGTGHSRPLSEIGRASCRERV